MKLYHATPKSNLDSIRTAGLDPDRAKGKKLISQVQPLRKTQLRLGNYHVDLYLCVDSQWRFVLRKGEMIITAPCLKIYPNQSIGWRRYAGALLQSVYAINRYQRKD